MDGTPPDLEPQGALFLRSPAHGTYSPPARRSPARPARRPSSPASPPRGREREERPTGSSRLVLTRRGRRALLEAVAML
ncbi:MAG TPA: hypothetical protein VMG80_04075, partial [Solirubrobacteraceae bacterium]|nr:hypothetical protein [Solirubrobacteraceae bacterium]